MRITDIGDGRVYLLCGDNLELLPSLNDESIDACVTDPPYGLKFMSRKWDYSVPSVEQWQEVFRVLKPGAHLLAFGGSRTYHRLVCNIEDAGFEIRDQVMWLYGSGFPKSMDVSKAIDKAAGATRTPNGKVKPGHEGFANRGNLSSVQSLKGTLGGDGGFARPWMDDPQKVEQYHQDTDPATPEASQWQGWGTALKPAHEPIVLARKPLIGTVAANVLEHGTGAMNIDACRVACENRLLRERDHKTTDKNTYGAGVNGSKAVGTTDEGRWPANVIHDGSDEVLERFPTTSSGAMKREVEAYDGESNTGFLRGRSGPSNQHGDSGSAARFFYCAKASKKDRTENGQVENKHPTVKPTDLMRYLIRLITPPDGVVLDPFMGSGGTGKAALLEGFRFVGIEADQPSFTTAQQRLVSVAASKLKDLT